ncbi:MAG: DUF2188 domain-containing protein [Planctomycetes bacterium]|jgi:hypothetical protein|nr:DUF2188 domain-containing protein [Planctomycetota bacterium]MCL4730347.1 DUF2188 domain-containing protein [Planctomycetota bacterium]
MSGDYARQIFLKTFGREPAAPRVLKPALPPIADDDDGPDHTDVPDGETQQAATAPAPASGPAKSADRIIYHVMLRKNDGRWSVLKQGRAKPNRVLETQAEAIEFAMTLARSEGEAWVITHTEDGAIAEEIHVRPPAAPDEATT